jgi:CDP-2,3-bis-(O-geranylgeranyl)-sn-glycerol synthase
MSIWQALWLFLPAGVANAAPVIGNKIPFWNRWQTALDFGRSYQGQRIFGDNKKWRGVIFAVLVGGLIGWLQTLWSGRPGQVETPIWIGFLLGFGAIYGDAAESFLKRRRGVSSGDRWFPFDQIDYIIGGLIAVLPLGLFGLTQAAAILGVYFGLHLLVAYIGYLLKLKDKPI